MKKKKLHKQKNSFSYRKNFVLHHSMKINKREGPNKLRREEGRSEKNRKINKRPPPHPSLLGTSIEALTQIRLNPIKPGLF